MKSEAEILIDLAQRVNRRRLTGYALIAIALVVMVFACLPAVWLWWIRILTACVSVSLFIAVLFVVRPVPRTTAEDFAQHLDTLFGQLEDSTALLLVQSEQPMVALQRQKVGGAFAALARSGALNQSVPDVPWRRVALFWAAALVVLALTFAVRTDTPNASSVTTDEPTIRESTVTLIPPDYTDLAASAVDVLDFKTFEGSAVTWEITLDQAFDQVELLFHDGEVLSLTPSGPRRWRSDSWPARSSVYRVVANNTDIKNGVFRIDAQPDQSPRIRVSQPDEAIRIVPPGPVNHLALILQFDVEDDYGIDRTQARVTLAQGKGEQVQFREEAVSVDARWADNRRRATVSHEFDLIELGMQPGDELYVFAEAMDNRVPSPNVGTSETFIVRWPGPDDAPVVAQATLSVPVLPEFFRSQRQLIIDTEKLIQQRPELDEGDFNQQSQSLAIDQKLLRLRYGQYLGEEEDSGIGTTTQMSLEAHRDDDVHDEHDEHKGSDKHSELDKHLHDGERDQSRGHEEHANDNHDDHDDNEPQGTLRVESHDHAGHADEMEGFETSDIGNAQAVMALNAHMHDRAEQATLFEPETRELLRSALTQMWDAERQLRLGDPDAALPFEYAALSFIKQVQQSDRIYLRRTGFRPTPIDEQRRLSGELDDIDSQRSDNDPKLASQNRRLRTLLNTLTHANTPGSNELRALTDIVQTRALRDPRWLSALSAMERLLRDVNCKACTDELVRELWRHLDNTLPAPSTQPATRHPLQHAYEKRLDLDRAGVPQ